MKESALVIIKPDGIVKDVVGNILIKFSQAKLEIIGMRVLKPTRKFSEEHYKNIKGQPFFEDVISYFIGKFHRQNKIIAIIYYGKGSIAKCRKIAGATNPEKAKAETIRSAYGRITTKGLYENVIHVSSDKIEAEREIKLWFNPDEVTKKIFPIKTKVVKLQKMRVWK